MKWICGKQEYELLSEEGQNVIPYEMIDTLETANSIIQRAQEEADAIIAAAIEKAKELKKEAQEAGFADGVTRAKPLMEHLNEELNKLKMDIQRVALPIALKAAKKIVGEELILEPGRIVDILLQAMKPVAQCKKIKIIVSPQDLAYLEKSKARLASAMSHSEVIQLEGRASLEPGTAIIESEKGIMNASLDHLWAALESLFESFI